MTLRKEPKPIKYSYESSHYFLIDALLSSPGIYSRPLRYDFIVLKEIYLNKSVLKNASTMLKRIVVITAQHCYAILFLKILTCEYTMHNYAIINFKWARNENTYKNAINKRTSYFLKSVFPLIN